MKKITFLFALLCASVMGWAVTYCDYATGHENNANFGDANGRILLTLVPTANANEYTLTVKPNYANGATKKLDYLYVIASGNSPYPAEAGADEGGTGYDELSVTFSNSNTTTSFTIQWSNPDWGGRWQCTLTDVALNELTSCSGGGDPDPDPDPTPDPDPVANPYCDYATGHENNANFGDANGRILLSLEPTSNANEYKLTLKPNYDNGATKKLDYMYVIANGNSPYPAEAGVDEGGTGYDELAVTFTNSNAKASFTIQWSNPDWGGRWQCTLTDVDFSTLSPCSAPVIASEYCGYQDPKTDKNGKNIALTWETDANGNVVITMGNGTGTTSCSFRNGGFEGGIGAFIVSTDDFATSEAASNYFTATQVYSGNTYTLTKKADLPANAKIKHVGSGHALAWVLDGNNEYCFPDFIYTYGGVCAEEKVLTEISLTSSATFAKVGENVTLTAQGLDQMGMPIDAEISFEVSPANAGSFSGNVFTFAKTGAATVTAKSDDVQKSITLYCVPSDNLALNKTAKGGYYDGNPGESFDKANDGSTATQWVTYADQATSKEWWYVDLGETYSLTAVDVVWGDPSSTSYKLYARTEAPSEEQEADDTAWEEIASVSGIGVNSEQFNEVSVNARYVRIHSLTRSSNYIRLKEVRVFGTEYVPVADTEAPVMTSASLASSTYTEAVVNVAATDNVGIYRYHVVDAANNIDANFAESEGKITINNLTHGTAYNFTITAKDAAGNESENSKAVAVTTPFDGSVNLALNKSCEGGYYDGNPAEVAAKANDGDNGTAWVTYGDHAAALDWWIVDLGKVYDLSNITALWANDAYATAYMLQARVEEPAAADKADDAAWVTLENVSGVTAGEERSTDVSGVGRYVRFRATAKAGGFFRLREFRVYGSGVATVDTEAPVMMSASLVSSADTYAVIAVSATDNQGIANYHVVDAANSIDGHYAAEAGNITVTGLTGGTSYTLAISAVDFFGNESANSKSVAVTTTAHYTEPQEACTAPAWDASLVKAIYSPTYSADCNFANWGGCVAYTDNTYGKKYAMGADCWGFGLDGFTLNCLNMEKLHADIWIADDASLRLVPIYGGTGLDTDDTHGKMVTLHGQQWNSIDLSLANDFAGLNLASIFQFKIDNANGLTFWIGNLYFYRETAIVDSEVPTSVSASVASEGFYSVSITAQAEDNSGAVSFKVMNGDAQVATGAAASGAATTITISGLAAGTNYSFNVIAYDETDNEAAPVAVVAATKALPASAPAPNLNGKRVVNVFSDAIEGSKTIHSGGWSETTIAQWIDIVPGDKVFYGQKFNYAGWHSWGDDIDATGMVYLHVDVYSTGMTQVSVTPISHDPGREGSADITLTPNDWTSADIALSAYAANNIEWNKIFQFKFMGAVGGDELLIDNVYFWRPADYTRAVTAGRYGTICLPQAGEMVGATLYDVAYLDVAANKIFLDEVPEGEMIAGRPYIFEPEGSSIEVYYTDDETASAGNYHGLYGFIGNSADEAYSIPQNQGCYILQNNQYREVQDGNAVIKSNRAYFKIGSGDGCVPTNAEAPAPGRRRVALGAAAPQVATGMEALSAGDQPVKVMIDGQLFILRGEKLYNVNGQAVK